VTTQAKLDHKLTPERERQIREMLGLAEVGFEDELASVLRCSTRQVQRYALPYWVIGNKRFYDLRRSAEKLWQIARIGTPRASPAVRTRRKGRERETAEPPGT
jgi:hypothetical protein